MKQKGNVLQILNHPTYYNNREVSWLRFNQRVLEEAMNVANPLLERLRFISIFSSNLDEFFMIRVAGLKDQIKVKPNQKDNKSGLTPTEQLNEIRSLTHDLTTTQNNYYDQLIKQLKKEKIAIKSVEQLSIKEMEWLEAYFKKIIFPCLTPLTINMYRPFPLLANRSINIAVTLTPKTDTRSTGMAIVQIPKFLKRLIQIKTSQTYVFIEDTIIYFLKLLFLDDQIKSTTIFRLTRDANMNIHEEDSQDLLAVIESELNKRELGAVVRIEVSTLSFNEYIVAMLRSIFNIEEEDVYYQDGPLDFTFLTDFYQQLKTEFSQLAYAELEPQWAQDLDLEQDIFIQIKQHDILLHHPYESFDPVIQLINTAAKDPNVIEIKQTLYRVSCNSPIIKSLETAAQSGKQVTVLVELKARFDEQNNVHWAKRLERSGCHVIYGKNGLKTHGKICLIIRKEKDKLERFIHLGTGNYNEQTATLYTDLSIISARESLAIDASNFFDFLSGSRTPPTYRHLSMAPNSLRDDFLAYIDREIKHQQQFGTGRIIAKMNALTDKNMIVKLYQASQAGVKIDLIVRGICCLKPGISGVSDHIRVHSIVGRFLEHSRIYYFYNNGEEEYYLSSADWMTRNLQRRIELLFPVLDNKHKQRLEDILTISLQDNTNRREQSQSGLYHAVTSKESTQLINSQLTFYNLAYQANQHLNKSKI
ncbi:RNA degradosome polyphosphate kinase [Amphibacillus sp. MSJ-3]|uniref:RNA degradosome polyphosphate kinase n=1 Tax=Amphibacillus sp. MSJ-3 TaxID=2841505 RepID=UPI001C0F0198|nr:RNA degradosome polyphosphate kinase [Amphibacillus sp. MSJ-3]